MALMLWLVANSMSGFCGSSFADPEIVVAIRYLKAQGTSHAQLYLYRQDGRLLRELTHDDSGQMVNPAFASDGETIVFTRELGSTTDYWSIEPRGGKLQRLPTAPGWYDAKEKPSFFTNSQDETETNPDVPTEGHNPVTLTAPDGSVQLILRETQDEDDQVDGPGHGKHYEIRAVATGKTTNFADLPGFEGVYEILHNSQDKEQRFLFQPPLKVAFFGLHLNSTDGDTSFALDLTAPRLIRLSPNWAAPIVLPGEPAFLTLAEVRYVQIPHSKKTANCSYIDRWNASFQKVRYSSDTAAICYGASMYRPGMTPAVITVRNFSEGEDP